MDPVFTLQWPEFVIAHRLQERLPKKDGYSILIPLSRQEKGVDLAILKKRGSAHRTITIQIKASRTYPHPPPKRASTRRFLHYTWFRRFDVPADADFILLLGMYAPDQGRTKSVTANWYRDCTLLFTQEEMRAFLSSCFTVGGREDQMFGFGFDDPTAVFLTRGDPMRSLKDFSSYLLDSRVTLLRDALSVETAKEQGSIVSAPIALESFARQPAPTPRDVPIASAAQLQHAPAERTR